MKKTLLALAAIAASSAVFAQSSVTLYGVVDASVESVKGDKTVTRVTSGNLAGSRLGFKGTEDIGGGLKANFVLENGLNVDTGATGSSTRFFDRAAWLGLAGGFGEVRLGRQDSPIGDIAGNVLGAQAYDDLKLLPTRAGNDFRRSDNAITYLLPTMVPGLAAQVQYSTASGVTSASGATGAEVAGSNYNKAMGLSVKYVAGPLSAGLGYESIKDNATAANDQKANATLVYAGYDFGAAKVTAYYDAETNYKVTAGAKRLTVLGAKVAVPFTPEFTMVAGLSTARNVATLDTNGDNVQIVSLKGIYTLSKRTAVYALFTNVNNGADTYRSVDNADSGTAAPSSATANVPTALAKTTHGIAVGVRHSF
ncbi:MAG: porin [Aquabacterium sp.]|nr:porin [Aquabacterium sp.]